MNVEMKSLNDSHAWDLVKKLVGAKLISYKCVKKLKEGVLGVEQGRCKARLVTRVFTLR